MASGSCKRRRTSPSDDIVLRDLPNEALCHAAIFLPAPSKVLFAIALSDDDAGRAIIQGEQWDILDFGGAGDSLASKITDDILQTILLCIGANIKLKRLKLTGCINITGFGLSPLRGSAVLEQVDLCLVADHKSPVIDPDPLLSCEHVLPILDSIIGRDDNVLRSIIFPQSWRKTRGGNAVRKIVGGNTVLNGFLERCNEVFSGRNVTCPGCDGGEVALGEETFEDWFPLQGPHYGEQYYTCRSCLKHSCYACEDENGKGLLKYCIHCKMDYCRECEPIEKCVVCEKDYCGECASMEECADCNNFYCGACKSMEECVQCGDKCCIGCIQECYGSVGGRHCKLKFCVSCAGAMRKECDKCITLLCENCSVCRHCA